MPLEKILSIWILLLIGPQYSLTDDIPQKICSQNPSSSACQQIGRSLKVACNYNFHNVDCLLHVQNSSSQLGRITGEDAMLASNLLADNVVVLGEIRQDHPLAQTVVIVKTNIPNGFVNLKNKTMCHPGFTHDRAFSHSLLTEFENKILETEQPSCDDNTTLVERHISTISQFFGKSCRPGLWTQSTRMDINLKNKYSSLCELCDGGCDVEYTQPFRNSLDCLSAKDADIAITTLHESKLFFARNTNQQNYKYLCKDGTSQSNTEPCIWSSKLYDLLVAETKVAQEMETFLRDNLKNYINSTITNSGDGKYKDALLEILNIKPNENITFLESGYPSLSQYVKDRVTLPTPEESIQCSRTLKWCTRTDLEQTKCEWLSQAAVNWAIQPVVECKQSEDNITLSCLDDLRKGRADIVVASSDSAYITYKKGLTSIAFPETDTRNLSVILAVTRANDNLNSFEDLKSKRACIPLFGGKEHLALIDTTRSLKIQESTECDYGKLLNDFIDNSCIPDVRSSYVKEAADLVDKDKLCNQCKPTEPTETASYCNADEKNAYYGNEGAIRCLRDQVADFAIISKIDIQNDTDLQVICKNNQRAATTGLNVDDDCSLIVLPNSEVVASQSNTKIRDIKLALYEFEIWFGQNLKKSFYLFDRFFGEKDLLFLDSTPGLNIDNDVQSIKDYKKLLRNVKECTSSAITTKAFIALILWILLLQYIF